MGAVSPWLYIVSRCVGMGGRVGESTAVRIFVAPKKNLPANCAALLAARCKSIWPVFDAGFAIGVVFLRLLFVWIWLRVVFLQIWRLLRLCHGFCCVVLGS